MGFALIGVGRSRLEEGQPDRARAPVERALALREAGGGWRVAHYCTLARGLAGQPAGRYGALRPARGR